MIKRVTQPKLQKAFRPIKHPGYREFDILVKSTILPQKRPDVYIYWLEWDSKEFQAQSFQVDRHIIPYHTHAGHVNFATRTLFPDTGIVSFVIHGVDEPTNERAVKAMRRFDPEYEDSFTRVSSSVFSPLLLFDLARNEIPGSLTHPSDQETAIAIFACNVPHPEPRPVTTQVALNDRTRKLLEGDWLSSSVMVDVAQFLNDAFPDCHVADTAVAQVLQSTSNDMRVAIRTTKKINKRKVFFPLNVNNAEQHWALFVVNRQARQFEYYDSLPGTKPETFFRRVKEMLKQMEPGVPWEDWKTLYPPTPKQENGDDCGVFVLVVSCFVAADFPLDGVKQADIPAWRRAMAAQLLSTESLSPFGFFL
jgi:hypothetical protein